MPLQHTQQEGDGDMAHLGRHTIVIGASIGGLLAARALADHYDEVTVLERDTLPEAHEPRKGVPQGRHAHGLLARGREVLEQLFPGLSEEMVAQGAVYGDVVDQVLWFNHGVYLLNSPSALLGLLISRPMLEDGVRRRLLQLPNVRLVEHSDALEPVFDGAAGRVTGVRVQLQRDSDGAETMRADLVVDASGRGSHSPAWLDALGYAKPREEAVEVQIGYMTRLYRRRPEHLPGKQAIVMTACRPGWRFGVILAQEDERWIVTLGGYRGNRPPMGDAGYIEFAPALRRAEPFPGGVTGVWRRPVQLQPNLRPGDDGRLRGSAGIAGVPGEPAGRYCPPLLPDGEQAPRHPLANRGRQRSGKSGSAGKRTAQTRFVNWYLAKLFQAAQYDAVLATRFLEVANLMKQPPSLMEPRIALRVWKGSRATA